MKGKFLALLVFVFCGSLAFAQTGNTALGISDSELNIMVEKYLEDTFNRYLNRRDLDVTEVSCTTAWNESAEDKNLNYYNAQARFRNFPIDNRSLTGRVETTVAVRKNAGSFFNRKPAIEPEDQRDNNIKLLIDDQLSDELRDSMVKNYITRNYNNPLDVKINNEQLEVYPDKIFSYVSSVVDNEKIISLRVVFDKQETKTTTRNPFVIEETNWQLNRAEQLLNKPFPDNEVFMKNIREDMYDPMQGYYSNTIGNASFNKGSSKIRSISKRELKEANDNMIKMELDLIYQLDRWGGPGSYKRYNVILNAFYQFNFEGANGGEWVYKGIEDIKAENIRAIN